MMIFTYVTDHLSGSRISYINAMSAPGSDASAADKIKWSLRGIERPSTYISTDDTLDIKKEVKKVNLEDQKELSFEEKVKRAFFDIGGPHVLRRPEPEPKKEETAKEQDAVCIL